MSHFCFLCFFMLLCIKIQNSQKTYGMDWKLACVIILALQSLLKSKTKKSLFMIFWTFFTKILLKRKYLQRCRCNHFHFLCVNGPNLYLQHIKNSSLLLSILFTYIFFAMWTIIRWPILFFPLFRIPPSDFYP